MVCSSIPIFLCLQLSIDPAVSFRLIEAMRLFCLGLISGVMLVCASYFVVSNQDDATDVAEFVDFLLEDTERFESVAFREVVRAVSNCEVLSVDQTAVVDSAMVKVIETALNRIFDRLALSENSIHAVGRVNEISRHVEDALLDELNAVDGYTCSIPLNATGKLQRSGYPDLRLVHEASGRVFYLDPKVYKAGSEQSSFRTFYFEPQRETNKILESASHLIVGIAHSGKVEGHWQFKSWQLVDLYDFEVRLKAEFQASNRDLYQVEAQLSQSAD